MQNSLPARPSLEQLKKLAKDLVKYHQEKQVEALALIGRHLPELSGKNAEEIAAYPFALHDAQSVMARQYGFPSWNDLTRHVEALQKGESAPIPDLDVAARLQTVLRAYKEKDYALWCSVMNGSMKAGVDEDCFKGSSVTLSDYFKADCQVTYMGVVHGQGRRVHFWRMWVKGWENDLFVRMALNEAGLISGLLFSIPFDTAIGRKK